MLLVASSFIAIIVFYWSTIRAMVEIWLRSDTFAHGLIVGPIAAFLIYRERHALSGISPKPFWPGLLLLLLLSLVWMVAKHLGINALEQFAVVALIPSLIWTVAGNRVVWTIGFALTFLFFAVPFGEFLIPQLMEITADLTTVLLRLTGFAVYRDGLFIAVPGGDFEIATACSGIRYLIASVVLGTIFAYLTFYSWRKRLIFIGFAIFVPILANGIRAYLIVVLASLSGMKLAVGVDHFIYGWVFFGIVMFVLFLVGVRFRDDHVDTDNISVASPAPLKKFNPTVIAAFLVALFVLLISPVLSSVVQSRAGDGVVVGLARTPADWSRVYAEAPWEPSFQPSDQRLRRALTNDSLTIYEFVDIYNAANGGVDAASSGNRLVDKKTWRVAATLSSTDADMRVVSVVSGQRTMYVATWYQINNRRTPLAYEAKLYEAWDTLLHGQTTSGIVALAIDAGDDNLDVLMDFVANYHPALSECLADPTHAPDCDG